AVHVTVSTRSSSVSPSSVVTGVSSFTLLTATVHPVTGCTDASAIAGSDGNVISTLVVVALSSSLGTWKVSVVKLPLGASSGLTVTCAKAGAAQPSTAAATTPVTASFRSMAAEPSTNRESRAGPPDLSSDARGSGAGRAGWRPLLDWWLDVRDRR